jgi:RHS repeat-associated protein
MKLMNKWFCLGITVLWAVNGLAQPANNNGGSPGAFDEQQQARDLTGKRGQQQVDLFTGSFGYSIPINCAPARNGSEPALALMYSSGGDNGWCGMGWKLDIGWIERNTKDGFPIQFTTASIPAPSTAYDDSKGFLMNLFGKELKLFAVATNGSTVEYRAETDTDFLRCFLDTSNNKWTVYDKSGNTYYFGQTSSSRVANPKTGWSSGYSGTFHWALDEVDTATGDQTTVAYTTYTGPDSSLPERTIYPTSITYNGHASINGYGATYTGQNTISFGTEIRPDRRVSYRWGFRTEQNRRLTNIVCQVGSQKVWRYAIGYTTSKATERSLLSTLTVYGSDDTTALPTQTFTYQQNLNGVSFGPTMEWTNMNLADPTTSGATDPYVTQVTGSGITIADLFDIDGDGLPDRVSWNGSSSPNAYQVQHNNGSGFGARYSFGPSSSGGGTTASDSNPVPDGGYYSALNGGYARMRDINGDGLPDRVDDYWKHFSSIYYATTPYTNFAVMLNTGSGFGSASMWPLATNDLGNDPNTYMSVIESGTTQPYVGLFDINGDGLPDRVMALYNQPEIYFKVQFNTGTNFMPVKLFGPYRSQNYTNSIFGIPWSGIETAEAHVVDINGDGLPDRLMYPMNPSSPGNELPYPATYYAVEFNDGYSFEATNTSTAVPGAADVWSGVATETPNGGIRFDAIWDLPYVGLYDLNGDGLPDRVMVDWTDTDYANTKWLVYLNNGRGFDTSPIVVSNIENQGQWSRSFTPVLWSMQGSDSSGTITTLMDINGDGLLDRVMKVYDNGFNNASTTSNFFLVQLNNGPFPDLLTNINNGIGGAIAVTYKPSTAWDNRQYPTNATSGSLLPFIMQTAATVTESDGINPTRTTAYNYAGGFYDGVRREFHGFALVTVTNPPSPITAPYNRRTVYYFHQGGGRDYSALGEYQDAHNFAKDGMAYRTETYGNDNNLYHVTVNQVNQASLGNGRYFPFVQLSFDCEYPGGGTPKVTATQFAYDTTTGNLTNKIDYGQVTNFNPASVGTFSFTDTDSTDTQYRNTHFAAISGNTYILDHPDDVSLTDGNNNVMQETKYSYNSSSGTIATKLTRITSGYYATNSYGSYTSYGLVGQTTDAVGVQTTIAYDSTYNTYPATTTIGSLATTTSYDARSGLLTGSTDLTGLTVTNYYDALFRPTESDKIPIGGGSAIWMKKAGYNLGVISSGNAVSYLDVTNNDGVGGVESRTYVDGFGRPIQSRTQGENGNYRVVSTTYDERGNAFLTTWPVFGTSITFAKPTSGQTATWMGYDAPGRVATNRPVNVTFDSNGAFSSKTDLTGDTGSPLAARTWSYVNGTDPWWVICTDQDGKVRRYQLDAFGRTNQIQEVDGANTYTTTLKYDLADNLTNIVNANSENIYFAFDNAGVMVAMADPYLGQWTYQRDYAGRLRVQTDARGDVVKLYYTNPAGTQDPLGRVLRKEIYSLNYTNQVLTLVSTVTNVYDSSDDGNYTVYPGLLYKTIDSQGWEKNGYDTRGRTIKTSRYLNINSNTYTTSYTLDDGDKVTSIAYPNSGPTITNTYFHGGSINQVSRSGGSYNYYTVSAGNYDEFGHVTQFAYNNNGLTTTRSYYSTSKRLQSISAGPSGSVFNRSFTYTTNDDIASLSGTGMSATTVTYDNLHRVKTYTGLTGSYGYDPVGNITTNIESGSAQAYDYGVRRGQAVKTVGGKKYLYDLCGNLIVRRTDTNSSQSLVYDPENQLTRFAQVGTNFTLVKFGYAGDGTRLWKWSNQTTNQFQVWMGNIYEEKGGKTLFHVFVGNEQICTFEATSPLGGGSDSSAVGYYYHQDNLNSSSALSGSSGSQQEVNVYYPFGRTQTASPQASFQVSRRFTGQILDAESGLYYYNARYYDPELGRFIQPDTVISDFSNPQSYNRYSYVLNNPLRYTDPTGHWVLFDKEAWGQLLSPVKNFFVGGQYPVNNERAMLAQEGVQQWTPLTANGDPNGEKLGNPATAVVAAGGGALVQAGMMVGPAGEEKAAVTVVEDGGKVVSSLEQRANELHSLLNPQAQRMRTTAVTATEEGVTVVSSSENALSKAQKAALKPGEMAVEGAGHAEITGINGAKQAGLTPTATAASRPICPTCAQTLKQEGVTPASPLKVPQQ